MLLTTVQLSVLTQHPPPRLLGQAICVVAVQPTGISLATALLVLTVLTQAFPSHEEPNEQHPPLGPGHLYALVLGQERGQHAPTVVGTPVIVDVERHW